MKIGVFFYGSRNELTGAGAVFRSFLENESIFQRFGIDSVVVYDEYSGRSSVSKVKSRFLYVKNIISFFLSCTVYGTFKLIDSLYASKGRKVIYRYISSEKQDEDVMIFHDVFTCIAYLDVCKIKGVTPNRFFLILHTNGEIFKMLRIYYPKFKGSKYEKSMEQKVSLCFEHAERIIFVAKIAEENFRINYPKYASKTIVVYNGIAQTDINYSPVFDGKVRMVTTGTVNARKNQKMIIECMGRLKNPDFYLTVIGGGNLLNYCKELASQYGITDHIEFLGPRRDVALLLAKSNVFVMSSLDEGLPISAIEAMRAKLPLILTDVGGNKELIDGNGYLISPNIEDLCIAIEKFAKDTNNQLYMSNKSLELFLQNFTVNRMIEEYCKVIKKEK